MKRTLNDTIREADRRGYRVLDDGTLVSPLGRTVKGYDQRGYLRTTYRDNGRVFHFAIHRLAAFQQFGEELFAEGIVVRHLNGNSHDNSRANIAIGTASDNAMDMPREARVAKAKRAASFLRAFSDDEVASIRSRFVHGCSVNGVIALAREYGVRKSTMSYIVNGKTYPNEKSLDGEAGAGG